MYIEQTTPWYERINHIILNPKRIIEDWYESIGKKIMYEEPNTLPFVFKQAFTYMSVLSHYLGLHVLWKGSTYSREVI